MSTEQRCALADTIPTTEVIRGAVTFPRDRLGEPLDISPERFDAWLRSVRRDAAREALDGLIGALNTSVHEIQNGPTPNPVAWQTGALWTRDLAKIRRDTHYPEETP